MGSNKAVGQAKHEWLGHEATELRHHHMMRLDEVPDPFQQALALTQRLSIDFHHRSSRGLGLGEYLS
jgi:hypothetical protein